MFQIAHLKLKARREPFEGFSGNKNKTRSQTRRAGAEVNRRSVKCGGDRWAPGVGKVGQECGKDTALLSEVASGDFIHTGPVVAYVH